MKLEICLVLVLGFVNGAKILVWPAEWSHWINMKVRLIQISRHVIPGPKRRVHRRVLDTREKNGPRDKK